MASGRALAGFTKTTGITVDVDVVPWDSLLQRILTAVTSGSGPDVVNLGNTWSASLQATGGFVEFDDAMYQKLGGRQRFLPGPLSSAGAAGKTPAAVPLYSNANGALYYNRNLLAKAGLQSPPKTWAELVEAGQRITGGSSNPKAWGYVLAGGSVGDNIHRAFVLSRQHGGNLFDANGGATFATPQNVDAFQQYVDLMAKDKIVNPAAAEYDPSKPLADFANGRAAMYTGPSRNVVDLKQLGMADDAYAVALAPAGATSSKVRAFVSGTNIAISQDTRQQDAAVELVKFLTSDAQQSSLTKTWSSLPVVSSVLAEPRFSTPTMRVYSDLLSSYAVALPQVPNEAQMETLLGGALKQLFAKAAVNQLKPGDVEAALAAANAQIKAGG